MNQWLNRWGSRSRLAPDVELIALPFSLFLCLSSTMPKRPTQLQEQSQRQQQQETDPSSVASSSSSSSSCNDCGSIGCKCMFVDARDTQDDDDDNNNNETHLLSSKTLTFPDSLDYDHMEEGRQCLLPTTTTNSSSESVASRTPRAGTSC